jgi:hypothetical protein
MQILNCKFQLNTFAAALQHVQLLFEIFLNGVKLNAKKLIFSGSVHSDICSVITFETVSLYL